MNRVRRPYLHVFVAAVLCLSSTAAVADDAIGGDVIVTKDMKPWEGCGECHDLDGVAANGHFPNLAGQKRAYFLKQMADFRDGKRANDHGQMGVSSREATGKVLDEIAAYFAGLPPPPPQRPKTIALTNLEYAKRLFSEGSRAERIPACANCHGVSPKHDFAAPCLEAQQQRYLEKQLNDFRSGRRTNDPEAVMQKVAQRLASPDIDGLSDYLAGLERPAGGTCAGGPS